MALERILYCNPLRKEWITRFPTSTCSSFARRVEGRTEEINTPTHPSDTRAMGVLCYSVRQHSVWCAGLIPLESTANTNTGCQTTCLAFACIKGKWRLLGNSPGRANPCDTPNKVCPHRWHYSNASERFMDNVGVALTRHLRPSQLEIPNAVIS